MVVHRSQLDPKYYDDEASKFVLMSTKARLSFPDRASVASRSVREGDFDDGATARSRIPPAARRVSGSGA